MAGFDLFQELPAPRKRALLSHLLEVRAGGEATLAPPSHGQRALWLVHRLDPDSAAYNVAIAARIRAGLDPAAMRRALQALVDRHASLRTTFTDWDGLPLRRVARRAAVDLAEVDATGWSEQRLRATLRDTAHRPFDLARGPLLRTHLFQRPGGEYVLLLTVHHIVFDIVSLVVLLDELGSAYAAAGAEAEPAPRAGAADYSEFVDWQSALLASPEGDRQWEYWRDRLTPLPAPLELPLDRPRPAVATVSGAEVPFVLDPPLAAAARALARSHHTTLYTVLLAAFTVLLHRYSGQSDVTVGSPFVGRGSAEFEGTVGYFINPVALRADCSGDPTFTELLGRTRRTVLGALEHQDYPLSLLVERLRPERDPSRSPLFQVMFNMPKPNRLEEQGLAQFLLGTGGARMDLGGLPVELFPIEAQVTMFDLLLGMVDAGPTISASMRYNTDLFTPASIERMTEHFRVLLTGLAADPGRRLSEYALLTEAARERLAAPAVTRPLVGPDGGPTPAWAGFLQRFTEQVEGRPDAVAVTGTDTGAGAGMVTYAELDRRARAVAAAVAARGAGREDVVAVLAERGVDLLATIIGLMRAGAAYLPLDPRWPEVRLGRVLRDARPALVLASPALAGTLDSAFAGLPAPQPPRLPLGEPADERSGDPAGDRAPDTRPGDLAYVIYTSGSTGAPKGAMVEHLGMVNHLQAKIDDLGLDDRDVLAQTASQCFDISVWQFLAPLAVGGRVHIVPDEVAHDPARLLAETAAAGVTVLETVPSMLAAMLAEADRADRAGRGAPALKALRWMISTGEELWPGLCRDWFRRFPAVGLVNAYGPTECSDDVTHHILREAPPAGARVPVGRPVQNTRIHVLDGNLRPLPENVAGELCVGGPGVGRGYLHDPERTARAFLPDPFGAHGDRLYRTGDLGRYRADGQIELLGRLDRQVKIRGNRIELGEVEAALAEHPGVAEAVVVVRGAGAEERTLVGYVVGHSDGHPPEATGRMGGAPGRGGRSDGHPPEATGRMGGAPGRGGRSDGHGGGAAAGAELDPDSLARWAARRLPPAMVPGALVPLAAMPRTPNGKVDRLALPAVTATVGDAGTLSPSGERVAAVLRAVLRVEGIGPRDSFFALGGHSLQATRALAALREEWGVELPLRVFMENPTVAGLADALDEYAAAAAGTTNGSGPARGPAGVPVARLAPDGRLAADIVPARPRPGPRMLRRVLVTGATGLVGAHVVDALRRESRAEIVCLVRAAGDGAARERLRRALAARGLAGPADGTDRTGGANGQASAGGRVSAVAGDVAAARLGLPEPVYDELAAGVDAVVHCAAEVNLLRPYSALKAVNVTGTSEVIRFACAGVTSELHLVSTIAALGSAGGGRVSETDPLDGVRPLPDGYTQSKWVAEVLAAEAARRGLPVAVYRPGRVSGDSRTGRGQDDDLVATLVALALGLGRAPDLDVPVDLAPADHVGQAIARLVLDGVSSTPAHLVNPAPARLPDVIDWVRSYGYAVESVPAEAWLADAAALAGPGEGLVELLGERPRPENQPVVDAARTRDRLRAAGLACPPVDERLVRTYLDRWVADGLLPPPGARRPPAATRPGSG